jgi:N-glycosylase/DNA lyase
MDKLVGDVQALRTGLKDKVDARIREFKQAGRGPSKEVFKELCFCILTANFNAEKTIRIQQEAGDSFLNAPEYELAENLRFYGHRYPETRAKYIMSARVHKDSIKETLSGFKTEEDAREWVVENVTGLGYKESSHFLRNIGYENLAIIDFHIIDLLARYGIIERPKTLTKKRYFEIERVLKELAKRLDLTLAELDLYLWYMETGKILK